MTHPAKRNIIPSIRGSRPPGGRHQIGTPAGFKSESVASVGGEVSAGARVPLSVKGDRLLDVIAAPGGVKAPVNETFVELSRGSTTSRIPLTRVIADPREDIYLHPNDILTLVRDPQTFIAYGATGRNAEIPFEADGITLAQALAKAGGLLDDRFHEFDSILGIFGVDSHLSPREWLTERGEQSCRRGVGLWNWRSEKRT